MNSKQGNVLLQHQGLEYKETKEQLHASVASKASVMQKSDTSSTGSGFKKLQIFASQPFAESFKIPQAEVENTVISHRNHLNYCNERHNLTVRRINCRPAAQIGINKNSQSQRFYKNRFGHFRNDMLMRIKNTGSNCEPSKSRRMIGKGGLPLKFKTFLLEFFQHSSIHGFGFLAKVGLSLIERILWFAFICMAIYSIASLSHRTWQRYQTSPMVISMDRNKLFWNTSFPSLTLCPHKRIDELKVEEYIKSHQNNFATEEDKEGFKYFLNKLASLSYHNIDSLPLNKTFGIRSDNYLNLLYDLKREFVPEISSGPTVEIFSYETQTEFGICFSVNSVVARYNSYEYWKENKWNLVEHGPLATVHPLDGDIFAQMINLSTGYDVYFHSPSDIPNIAKQRYTFGEAVYTTVELTALEITTDEAAKAFSTKQRKCRFQHETENMLTAPIYSYGLCLAECRLFLALRVCNCVPHFYRNKLRNGQVLPICDLKGLGCVASLKKEMISLKSKRYKIDCNCLANCDDSNFLVLSYNSRVWFLGTNFQWGIINYPKMQLRRNVIFSFADVLVYIGGLGSFFLGCSILGLMEIIYHFTVRFIRRFIA